MKLTFIKSKIDETHFNKFGTKGIDYHYDKHVAKTWDQYFSDKTYETFPPISKEDYDIDAHELSLAPVKTSDINSSDNIVGFVSNQDNRIIKYSKVPSELVIYKVDTKSPFTVSYYATNPNKNDTRYKELFSKSYLREISEKDEELNRKDAEKNIDNNLVDNSAVIGYIRGEGNK